MPASASASAYAAAGAAAPPKQRRFRIPGPARADETAAYDPYRSEPGFNDPPAQPRQASLTVSRLEPWSIMKFSFLMSLVAWIVLFVAVALLYYTLAGLGVFASIQQTLSSVTSSQGSGGASLSSYLSPGRVLGYTMLLGAVDVILITGICTVGSVVYNLIVRMGGGIEVVLKETE